MTALLLRFFALFAALAAAGIAVGQAKTAAYHQIANRISQNQPYAPTLVLDALRETSDLSPNLACASGTTVDRAIIALRALDDSMAGHSDLALGPALKTAADAVDDGLVCRPLTAQLWLGRFWVRALAEGFRPPLRDSYDRAIATAPYDGWMMRLRAEIGSRWFFSLSEPERQKFFEDLRFTVDMGFLDEAITIIERLNVEPERLTHEIDQWPLVTRDRFARRLLSKGIDLKLATDFQLKPWEHY